MLPLHTLRSIPAIAAVALLVLLSGCSTRAPVTLPADVPPGPGVPARVDLERFMGDWWVVGHIPTGVESNAAAAIESYRLRGDGTIDIRYTFCDGVDAPELTELRMSAWVHDEETNAEWRVRPFWPLRLVYVIDELAPDYSYTVITHPFRSWAWIMAREPALDPAVFDAVVTRLGARGFDTDALRRVPPTGRCRPAPEEAR